MYFVHELDTGGSIMVPSHLCYFYEVTIGGSVIMVVGDKEYSIKATMQDIKYDLMKLSNQAANTQIR